MNADLHLIIFDCDGTLVDSQDVIVRAMTMAFEDHGLQPLDRTKVLSIVGLSLIEAISTLLPAMDRPGIEAVSDSYKGAFFKLRHEPDHHEPLYDGALAAIEHLAGCDNVLLGIATGKSRRGLDALFERENLAHFFTTIQTADNAPSKPHPQMIQQAMADVGADPAQTVMIGDTTYDIEMACAAKVRAIGVGWGYHDSTALRRAGAQTVVGNFDSLLTAINPHRLRVG